VYSEDVVRLQRTVSLRSTRGQEHTELGSIAVDSMEVMALSSEVTTFAVRVFQKSLLSLTIAKQVPCKL
jgi:hypothetical protein